MRFAIKCVKMPKGLIYFVEGEGAEAFDETDISISVDSNVGIIVKAKDISMPVFDDVLDHLVDSPAVMISFFSLERFVEDRATYLELDKGALLEAKGAWNYVKSQK
jgi:hypothetical protein